MTDAGTIFERNACIERSAASRTAAGANSQRPESRRCNRCGFGPMLKGSEAELRRRLVRSVECLATSLHAASHESILSSSHQSSQGCTLVRSTRSPKAISRHYCGFARRQMRRLIELCAVFSNLHLYLCVLASSTCLAQEDRSNPINLPQLLRLVLRTWFFS